MTRQIKTPEIEGFIKVHQKGNEVTIGACDVECIGLSLHEGKFQFQVTEAFFHGDRKPISQIIPILQKSTNFTAVGEHLISKLVELHIIHPGGILEIEGIPIAMKIIF